MTVDGKVRLESWVKQLHEAQEPPDANGKRWHIYRTYGNGSIASGSYSYDCIKERDPLLSFEGVKKLTLFDIIEVTRKCLNQRCLELTSASSSSIDEKNEFIHDIQDLTPILSKFNEARLKKRNTCIKIALRALGFFLATVLLVLVVGIPLFRALWNEYKQTQEIANYIAQLHKMENIEVYQEKFLKNSFEGKTAPPQIQAGAAASTAATL